MLFDIPDERGGAFMEKRWGESTTCHYPLINFIKAVPMPHMALVYAGLWIGEYNYHFTIHCLQDFNKVLFYKLL